MRRKPLPSSTQKTATPIKYSDTYRIPSARRPGFDYGSMGAYFITICTRHREHFFGEICDGEMVYTDIGLIIANEWQKTPIIRPNIALGSWVVMPDHFHGIIIIRDQCNIGICNNTFGPQSQNLGSIIRGFKGAATKQIHAAGHCEFGWHPRYHDHIIRDQREYERISQYIINNPINWTKSN